MKSETAEVVPMNKITETAFDLFRTTRTPHGSAEQQAIRCFRDATAFLKIAGKFSSGEMSIEAIDNNPLDEANAPNLKKTHPANLISRKGVEGKEQLDKRLTMILEIYEIVKSVEVKKVEDLNWGEPECNQARAIFPAVLERAELLKRSAVLN